MHRGQPSCSLPQNTCQQVGWREGSPEVVAIAPLVEFVFKPDQPPALAFVRTPLTLEADALLML